MVESRYGISSVGRAVHLLRLLAEQDNISLEQAAAATKAAKSTAFRLLDTLLAERLVEKNPEGGYRAGPEFIRWSLLLLGRVDVSNSAAAEMHSLWQQTGETIGLAILTGDSIVLTEILESPSPFRMAEVPGTTVSPHSSGLGQVILAYLGRDRMIDIVGQQPFEVVTANSLTTLDQLESRLELVKQDGYALDIEESALGVGCVAAPIFMGNQIVGGISIAAPRVRMSDEQLRKLGPIAAESARQISLRLTPVTPGEVT